ncbi:MAG: hypothetical protein R3C01_06450 [Planctomycetaceae bacterium]
MRGDNGGIVPLPVEVLAVKRLLAMVDLLPVTSVCLGMLLSAGCLEVPTSEKPKEVPAAEANAGQPAAGEQPQGNPLHREAKLVDRNKFLAEHPNAIEIEKNVINASDPFSAASQGYFAAVSSLMVSAYTHDLQLWRELNNQKWPTFAEYQEILQRNNVKFKGLKPGQVYGYDDQQGTITILEAPSEG